MQGHRGSGSSFNSDPFTGFSAFGDHGSLMSSFFGRRDPFDDPFFTQPMGGMFESGFFGSNGSPFSSAPHAGLIEQRESQFSKQRGPVIEEVNSDDEMLENGGASNTKDDRKKHPRHYKEPHVENPDDEVNGGRNTHIQRRPEFGNQMYSAQPQSQFYTFQSSTVSYGGGEGAYYTKSLTGSDGVAFEEFKEADSTTGQANDRISRGVHNKGHTLSRKLCPDGKVDTTQMLDNLDEGELDGFEQAWEGSSSRHLTGSRQRLEGGNYGTSIQERRGGWALPFTQHSGRNVAGHGSRGRTRT